MQRSFLLIATAALLSVRAQAQNYFSKGYGLEGIEDGWSVRQTDDGGFVFVGSTNDTIDAGDNDAYLVRTNSAGELQWAHSYGSGGRDIAEGLTLAAGGGYVLAGNSHSWDPLGVKGYLVKTDDQGTPVWARTYGDSSEYGMDIRAVASTDNGYIAVGEGEGPGIANFAAFVLLLDGTGDTLATWTFDGPSEDKPWAVRQVPTGGYIVAGTTRDLSSHARGFLMKLGSDGAQQWAKTYDAPNGLGLLDVQALSGGGFATVAATADFGAGWQDIVLIRTDVNGDTLWTRTYGTTAWESSNYLAAMPDGGFTLVGREYNGASGRPLILRTSADGTLLWTKQVNGNQYDEMRSVITTTDGGLAVTGNFTDLGNNDIYLIKTTDGAGLCNAVAPPALITGHAGLTIAPLDWNIGHAPLTVRNRPTTLGTGCVVHDVCVGVGFAELETAPQISVSPNPTNGIVRLTAEHAFSNAFVTVLDVMGARVFEQRVSGPTLELTLAEQPAGIYFLHVQNELGCSTLRLVKE